ncbi:MAG: hypothetical protein P1U34_03335 [Coxiellaceae bacterium]|nr:hypothetical protein [Coxiellaceae bacterium]
MSCSNWLKSMLTIVGCIACVSAIAKASTTGVLRDPTQPPGATYELQAYNKNINVQAIYYSKENSSIIVDGKTYTLGDTLSGAVITEIKPDKVVLQGTAGEVVLNMYPTVRKSVEQKKNSKGADTKAQTKTKTETKQKT